MFLAKIVINSGAKIANKLKFFKSSSISLHFEDHLQSPWKGENFIQNLKRSAIKNQLIKPEHVQSAHLPIQVTAFLLRCKNQSTERNVDFYIRILRSQNSVSYLPSVQYLQSKFSDELSEKFYNRNKDLQISSYQCKCSKCNTQQSKQFSKNGLDFGVVLSQCEECFEFMVISDNFNWFNLDNIEGKLGGNSSLKFQKDQVENQIKNNLKSLNSRKLAALF